MHDGPALITTFAAALGVAVVLGYVAVRLRMPALVGYMLAGVIIGPATPGFVADMELAQQLSEIGIMLLMFGVGLHFSLEQLLAVRRIAVPGAVAKIALTTALGAWIASLWGWSLGAGLVFGLALSVASTVVLLRALEHHGTLDSPNGHIAVGWLVVEDLVMVLVLVLLPPLAGWLDGGTAADAAPAVARGAMPESLLLTLAKVATFVALMLIAGRRIFPWLLWQVARTGSRELFTLCVIAAAVSIAYGTAAIFGVSFALGAFFAGMVLNESSLSHRAAEQTLPLRDAFSVLFFVSVGMLFDPTMLIAEPMRLLVVLAVVLFAKTLFSFLIVIAFRYPLNTALAVSAGLAQIGEFSFILAALGVSLGVLPVEGQSLLVAGALLSIALNPLMLRATEPLQEWIRARSALARLFERPDDPLAEIPPTHDITGLTGHVVLVGYGRVGQRIADALSARQLPLVIAEQNRELVERLRERGFAAVAGDATEPAVLIQAHVARARMLVVAVPDAFGARKMLKTALMLNPGLQTVVRVHSDEEGELLRAEKAGRVFMGEHELAIAMTNHVIGANEAPDAQKVA